MFGKDKGKAWQDTRPKTGSNSHPPSKDKNRTGQSNTGGKKR